MTICHWIASLNRIKRRRANMEFKFHVNETVVKVALVFFNFVFSILSIALVALGVIYMEELSLIKQYAGLEFFELSTFLIVLGSVSFITSLVGCYCVRNDNPKLMRIFIIVLCILLAIELTISLISYMNLNGSLEKKTKNFMRTQLLSDDISNREEFYDIEKFYDCCGIDGAKDYLLEDFASESCCQDEYGLCTETHINDTELGSKSGCAEVVVSKIQQIALKVGCYCSALAGLRVMEVTSLFMGLK